MFKISKRKLMYLRIISIIILVLIIFISIFLIHKKLFIQKKIFSSCNSSTLNNALDTIKTVKISSNDFNNDSNIVKQPPIVLQNIYKNYDWRIVISKINVDAPILEGVSNEVLRKGVGHFSDSSLLDGNICLAAHNRGYKYNYFKEIKDLKIGDDITYILHNNIKYYKVTSNTIIKETDMSVIENTNENRLTLITCETDKREYRRCIQACEI